MTKLRALFICLLGAGALLILHPLAYAKAAASQPNFVILQTDDQPVNRFHGSWTDYYGNTHPIMPNVMSLIKDQGMEFTDYMTPFPLCAPSRASLWSGEYAHNDGVIRIGGDRGGYAGYKSNPINTQNLPVWLQRAGYHTAHFGKFINFYGGLDTPETDVPPGWDTWVSDATDNSTREDYGYQLNRNGAITDRLGWPGYDNPAGRDPVGCPFRTDVTCNYHEDSMSLQAVNEIANSGDQPFLVQVDYHTPHGDSRPPIGPEPPVRYYDTAINTPLPKPPGFDEADVSDKPFFLRDGTPRLTAQEKNQISIENQKSIEAIRGVDDGVKWIIDELKARGILNNTYIIFTSDNGYFSGQHRITRGKLLPYEPAIRVPFVIRGPGIKKDITSSEPMANQDIAPTITRLAHTHPGATVDGRSMVPFWKNPKKRSRRPILISQLPAVDPPDPRRLPAGRPGSRRIPGEAQGGGEGRRRNGVGQGCQPDYVGLRVGPYKYVEYEEGEGELYLLTKDPAELHNRFGDPRFAKVQAYLAAQLAILRGCKGATCRAEVPKWPKPPL